MAQKLIRNIPDETMQRIEQMAQAAGQNSEEYIREMLVLHASGPIIKKRYAIRFYDDSGFARGLIRRFGDSSPISHGYEGLHAESTQAVERAIALVQRNGAGDREKAMWELQSHFGNVFEVPV